MTPSYRLPLAMLVLLIAACNDNDNGATGAAAPVNSFSDLATREANAEPASIADLQRLLDDIGAIFGDADGAPTDVQANDSVADVITRAGG